MQHSCCLHNLSSCAKFICYFFLPHISTNGEASESEISQILPSTSHPHNYETLSTPLHSLQSLSVQVRESSAIVTAIVHTSDLQPQAATILEESIHRYPRTYSTQFPQPSTSRNPTTYPTQFPQPSTSIYPRTYPTQLPQQSTSTYPRTYSTQFPQPSTSVYPRTYSMQFLQSSTSRYPTTYSTQFLQPSTSRNPVTYSTQFPQPSTSIYPRTYSTQFPEPSTTMYPRTYSTQFLQPSTIIYHTTYSTHGKFLQPSSSSVTLYITLSMPPRREESLNTLASIHKGVTSPAARDDHGVSDAAQWPLMFGIVMGSFLFIFFIFIIVMIFVVRYTRRHREANKLPISVEMFVNTVTTQHQNTHFGKQIIV